VKSVTGAANQRGKAKRHRATEAWEGEMVSELAQRPAESPQSWLSRLQAMDVEVMSSAQRRARISYLAEARRSLQEEQKAKWDRGKM
jgi:hypothetical protein